MSPIKQNEKIIQLKSMLRSEVKAISPYQAEIDSFKVKINLAGNESPFDLPAVVKKEFQACFEQAEINRYPDIYSEKLQQKMAAYLSEELKQKVTADQVIVGNGSDNILDILIRAFVNPGDKVLAQAPTFSMYKYFTELSGGEYLAVPLNENFNYQSLQKIINQEKPKIIFFCSPNNPTGQPIARELILKIAELFTGPVIVDEAYADFSELNLLSDIKTYPNLAVTRTFSKAFGLAGIRFGYLYGNKALVEELKKVLVPYNLNSLTDLLVSVMLDNIEIIKQRVAVIKEQRQLMYQQLNSYQKWRLYPSMANFLYIEGQKTTIFKKLLNQHGIKVRSYNSEPAAIRITIGSAAENEAVLNAFAEFKQLEQEE